MTVLAGHKYMWLGSAWTMVQFKVLKVEMRKERYPIGTIEKYVNK